MPLVIITGLPTSGKSTRARQLHDYLAERIASSASASTSSLSSSNPPSSPPSSPPAKPAAAYRLHLISDASASGLGASWRAAYDLDLLSAPGKLSAEHVRSANAREKDTRAAVYGVVKRALSQRDLVVLDGLNYIKGWRYQLFCEAKNAGTPSIVLQVGCGVDRARAVNERRLSRKRRGEGKGTATREMGGEDGRPVESSDAGPRGDVGGESSERNNQPAPPATPAPTTMSGPANPLVPSSRLAGPAPTPDPDEPPARTPAPNNIMNTTNPTDDDDDDDSDDEEPYSPSSWQNLVARYEEPNPLTRWDSPLFALAWDDGPDEARRVFGQIWDRVAGASRPARIRPNQAAAAPRQYHHYRGGGEGAGAGGGGGGGDYLYALERETQDVVRHVLEAQARADEAGNEGGQVRVARRSGGGGGSGGGIKGVVGPGARGGRAGKHDHDNDDDDDDDDNGDDDNDDLIIELPASRKVGLAQLQRHRRAFVGLNRGGMGLEAVGPMGIARMRESFVGFLNDSFEADG